jgi:hypothetical protein
MALASHGGSGKRGGGNQRSRQKFKLGHTMSPLDMKSQRRLAPLWKWSGGRPIKGTFSHVPSTPREVGASCDHELWRSLTKLKLPHVRVTFKSEFRSLNWFLIEDVAFNRHVWADPGAMRRCREFCWGDPSKKDIREAQRLGRGEVHARNS